VDLVAVRGQRGGHGHGAGVAQEHVEPGQVCCELLAGRLDAGEVGEVELDERDLDVGRRGLGAGDGGLGGLGLAAGEEDVGGVVPDYLDDGASPDAGGA
jgi:hypothetical protein